MFSKEATLLLVVVYVGSAIGKLNWQALLTTRNEQKVHNALSASTEFNTALKDDAATFTVEGLCNFAKYISICIVKTEKIFYSAKLVRNKGKYIIIDKEPFIASKKEMADIEHASEMYGILYLKPPLRPNPELAEKVKPGTPSSLWEIDCDGKKYAALINYDNTSFAFVIFAYGETCNNGDVVKGSTELIVVGYSQMSDNFNTAKNGLLEYLYHPEAFGQIPYLASYYTGYEGTVELAIDAKLQEIETIVVARQGKISIVSKRLLRTWMISNYTKCIGVLTCDIVQDSITQTIYFFVIYEASLSTNIVKLEGDPFISVLTTKEFSCMMALIDHLKPNHISEQIEHFEVDSVDTSSDGAAIRLLYAADYAARKHILKNRDIIDKTPYINHPLVLARLVMEGSCQLRWEVYAAIYLRDTLQGINTTEEEFNSFFGENDKILKLVNSDNIKFTSKTDNEGHSDLDETILKTYETKMFAPGALVEGNTEPESVLYSHIKERIRKKYVVKLKEKVTRPFTLALERSYRRSNTLYGLYNVNVTELKKDSKDETVSKEYVFKLKVSSPDDPDRRAGVVGEMHEDVKSITDLEDIDMAWAEVWKKNIGPEYNLDDDSATNCPSQSEVCQIVKCLEYASRKHFNFFQQRKDSNKTPYINHPIEGGIFEIDLILAALLHDTLENTSATSEELAANFNPKVASIVVEVSDDLTANGVAAETADKKAIQNEKAKKQSLFAVLVKLADRIQNLRDFGRQCEVTYGENKRRWQFSNAEKLLTNYMENRNNYRKAEWEDPKNVAFLRAFGKLTQELQRIIDDFKDSLKSAIF